MIFYTLEGLYTAISESELDDLFNDKSKAERRKHIIFCLEKAKEITLEILGTSADRVLSKDHKIAPATLRECIEVQAAIFLSTISDKSEPKEHLIKRLAEAKNTLELLRNSEISPSKKRNRISFGNSEV